MDSYHLTNLCWCPTITKLFSSNLNLVFFVPIAPFLSSLQSLHISNFPPPSACFSPTVINCHCASFFFINHFLQTSNDLCHSSNGYHKQSTFFWCDVQKKGNPVHCLCTVTDWSFPRVFCCEFKSHHQLSPPLLPPISTATQTGHKQACRGKEMQAPAVLTCF